MGNEELEKLYSEALNAEVPDFWDKIEAGIKASAVAPETDNSDAADSSIISIDAAREKKQKPRRNMRPYIGLIAAAVLMVVIAVPVFIAGFGDRRKNDSNDYKEKSAESVSMEDPVSSDVSFEKAEQAAEGTTAALTEAAAAEMAAEAEMPEEAGMKDAEEAYYEDTEAAYDEDEGNYFNSRGEEASDNKKGYTGVTSAKDGGKTVILRADVVQKGDKYVFVHVEPEKDKLEYEEYEVENPDELVKYMDEFDGEIKVWVCAVKDNMVYVYGPAED